jgi:flagellar M-ring protein FliF
MQQFRDRFRPMLAAVSPSQRVVIAVALTILVAAGFIFSKWLNTPSYAVLYSNLDDASLSKVLDQLNTAKAKYKLNGKEVMVPISEVYTDRAKLAAAKVGGPAAPPGYELFDSQSLTASSFTQQVNYQRALEGELDKTLTTLTGVRSAAVRLAIPQDALFTADQKAVTAAVLLDTSGTLPASEVDTVVFIVSSAVQGLSAKNVTVADTSGTVLSAPGGSGSGANGDLQTRQRQDLEATLTSDVQRLVSSATGKPGGVVVHAQLNFDQRTSQIETYDPKASAPITQATTTETLSGNPAGASGILGVAGGALATTTNTATSYAKSDASTTFGAGHQVTSTTVAPGQVQKLSVGIVVDDGTKTHAAAPNVPQLTQLVTAALGLDPARGDTISISAVPSPAAEGAAAKSGLMSMVTQAAGAAVLVIVAVFLLLMAKGRRRSRGEPMEIMATMRRALEPAGASGSPDRRGALGSTSGGLPVLASPRQDVMDLVVRQPEEIAILLRSWLADRRTGE